MDLVTVLKHAQSADTTVRNEAEAYLNQAAEAQYGQFVLALCLEFAADGKLDSNRQLAGLYLKNLISAQDEEILEKKRNKWLGCEPALKEQIRSGFVQSLLNPNQVVRHTAAQILAAFGAVDVPRNDWPSLIPALLTNVLNADVSQGTKIASLEALGYLCEAMDPEGFPPAQSNQILSAIINGLRSDLPNEIRLVAITALNNSLDFTETNFEVEIERDAIVKTIFEATQSTNVRVREKSFECFAKIAELYYEKLTAYVTTMFQLTTHAIQNDEEIVGLQAIEFWVVLCDCELSIMDDQENDVVSPTNLRIIEQAAPALIPFLLNSMTKQSDDIDENDTWNMSIAAAQCLDKISITIQDNIVDLVLPFITTNIQNPNWHFKEAAVMAFGSIVEGPSETKMSPIVSQAIPVLVSCLQDPSVHVRETTAWTIGKICEWHKASIGQDVILPMVNALALSLEDKHPKVASQACYAVHNLAEACQEEREAESNVISLFMGMILQKLFVVAIRQDWDEENLRVGAYEAVSMIVHNSAVDMRPIVLQVMIEALTRLEATFSPQYDQKERVDMQSMLCGVIGECIQKLELDMFSSHTDKIMQSMLQVFNGRGAVAHEDSSVSYSLWVDASHSVYSLASYTYLQDAFMAIGYLAYKAERDFNRYLPYLLPSLLSGLKNVEEYQVCTVAVGLVGDLSRALGDLLLPYCDEIMTCLIELLKSLTVNKIVKPPVISTFADVAMAIGGSFEKYAYVILMMLKQAGDLKIETDDEEMREYISTLHTSIFEAYSGILQGLKDGKRQDCVLPALDSILEFTRRATVSEDIPADIHKAAVGLLGDLAQTFGKKVISVFKQPFVNALIQRGLADENVKETAAWAQSVISHVIHGRV